MISVLILTLDEEVNIADCICSIPWRDDVHVLDSGSHDETVAIARQLGATVHTRAFDTYSRQRNFGLGLPFTYPWVLMLDADERLSPELAREIADRLEKQNSSISAYRVRRKDMFMGRWLKRSSGYPSWFPRLFRKGCVTVKRDINEEYDIDGETGSFEGHLIHYPFNKGVSWWVDRHNRYSSMEAETLAAEMHDRHIAWGDLFSADPLVRRANLKQILYRLPGRPVLLFMYLYLFRLGFLDGRAGLTYASLRFCYEMMISAKLQEARQVGRSKS
ncbi:MAG: glycosyltransferase family 2 protein [Hyphomicrobiaceae bacterium]